MNPENKIPCDGCICFAICKNKRFIDINIDIIRLSDSCKILREFIIDKSYGPQYPFIFSVKNMETVLQFYKRTTTDEEEAQKLPCIDCLCLSMCKQQIALAPMTPISHLCNHCSLLRIHTISKGKWNFTRLTVAYKFFGINKKDLKNGKF